MPGLVRFAILRSFEMSPRKIEPVRRLRRRRRRRRWDISQFAGGTTRPSGMEMQSRSRYVWISSKEPPGGSGSVYASRFRIAGHPGVSTNWVVVVVAAAMHRAAPRRAPACGTCRLTFFPRIPPAYVAQLAPSPRRDIPRSLV